MKGFKKQFASVFTVLVLLVSLGTSAFAGGTPTPPTGISTGYVDETSAQVHINLKQIVGVVGTNAQVFQDGVLVYEYTVSSTMLNMYEATNLTTNKWYTFEVRGNVGDEYYTYQCNVAIGTPDYAPPSLGSGDETNPDQTVTVPPVLQDPTEGPLYADGIPRTSGWDMVNYDEGIPFDSTYHPLYSSIFESTGGDVKININPQNVTGGHNYVKAEVYEDDGAGTVNDDYVVSLSLVKFDGLSHSYVLYGVDKWKDGTNNRAEFYVKYTYSGIDSSNVIGHSLNQYDYD